uniref:7TM GPCR serpentine receptor class x (Srx) domain-containing protein n=1 Tax=Acrobeloides nanus TaxID=290746 RepID=A0A914E873_9BILA
MVLTVALITVNGVILYGARDFYLMLNPTNSNYIFFIGAINKGMINLLIFFWTQRELRNALLPKLISKHFSQPSNMNSTLKVTTINNNKRAFLTTTTTAVTRLRGHSHITTEPGRLNVA